MSKELIESKKAVPQHVEPSLTDELNPNFRGYSIEELRYQRALIALRKDFCLTKMAQDMEAIRNRGLFGGTGAKARGPKISGLAGKLISGLGYMDYAMIGMSIFGTGKKIFKFFKRKKN